MNFTQSFKLALKSLRTSKMRAFLTMLGIIIGVGAVIVIISLGNGLTGMVQQQDVYKRQNQVRTASGSRRRSCCSQALQTAVCTASRASSRFFK